MLNGFYVRILKDEITTWAEQTRTTTPNRNYVLVRSAHIASASDILMEDHNIIIFTGGLFTSPILMMHGLDSEL
jgi:hypothetical protein